MKKQQLKSDSHIHIGLNERQRQDISAALSTSLADAFTLYLKTHNFHWNVTGPMFNSLHIMFESQYTEQWAALDEIAERIRALGFKAPGSYTEFISLTSIDENEGVIQKWEWDQMVHKLVKGNEALCRTHRSTLELANAANDQPTVDLMTQRLQVHEKNAWMLRALLE